MGTTDHSREAAKAKEVYQRAFDHENSRKDWHKALRDAREAVGDALRSSKMLRDLSSSLQDSGRHMLVYRHLLAPPTSQDQFSLLSPRWPKTSEKSGRGLPGDIADEVAEVLYKWFDPGIASWLSSSRRPTITELRQIYERASSLIASGRFATDKRTQISAQQEKELIDSLLARSWVQVPSQMVEEQSSLQAFEFMHKTRFATNTQPQEVDVACGLGKSYVLAIECKVTNDETNSVKRVNDVLKKANAWKEHWGNFVKTAALLQGVIKPSDVKRLEESGVLVFWSHDLGAFERWLDKNLQPD